MAQVAGSRERSTSGVLAASLTPMKEDGAADVALLAGHCKSLLDTGCTGIVLLGTTGEANSFTVSERQAILEGVLASGVRADRLIVGTGCCAVGDTIALTRHALRNGVVRVLTLPPFYYKNVTDEGLFASFAAIIEGAEDERLRLYLYLIPQFTGIEIGAGLIERLAQAYPQQIAGLKDSSGNRSAMRTLCRAVGQRLDVLVGNETFLLDALGVGAAGCISATANVNAAQIIGLFQNRASEKSRQLEQSVRSIRAKFERYPLVPALKTYLAATTGRPGWRNVRVPLEPLSADEARTLLRLLD